ncbi:MAG: PIN domain-containing protein [Candidatus Sericytochromatia bacterium]|nr:PIN domain-containing protein [Candidatus Sericytochromatia bacterium]
MKVLLDTHVVLDLLLARPPFVAAAASLVDRVERGQLTGFLCATTLTTVHYLVCKAAGDARAVAAIKLLLNLFEIAPVDQKVLEKALLAGFGDFEDAVLHEAALQCGVDVLITRHGKDFKAARLLVQSPDAFEAFLRLHETDGNQTL